MTYPRSCLHLEGEISPVNSEAQQFLDAEILGHVRPRTLQT